MSGINCTKCPLSHGCCGRGPICQPYLLPHEVSRFNPLDIEIVIEKPQIYRLKRRGDTCGCVYYDMKTKKCTDYENRPIECKLYPWIYHRDKDKAPIPFFTSEMFDAPKEWWDVYFSIPWDL